jgi:hypothetical protein
MRLELAQNGTTHHIILDDIPVGPDRTAAVVADQLGVHRCFGKLNGRLVLRPGELLRLEVVFHRLPWLAFDLKAVT